MDKQSTVKFIIIGHIAKVLAHSRLDLKSIHYFVNILAYNYIAYPNLLGKKGYVVVLYLHTITIIF